MTGEALATSLRTLRLAVLVVEAAKCPDMEPVSLVTFAPVLHPVYYYDINMRSSS
jgi:hypothetical protein